MDWWDTGKVSERVVQDKLCDVFLFSEVPSTRETWSTWCDGILEPRVIAGRWESDATAVLIQVERPIPGDVITSSGRGLCSTHMHSVPYLVRLAIFHQWEHFSGNFVYPVPIVEPFELYNEVLGTTVVVTQPEVAYYKHPGGSYTGSYGGKRLELKWHAAGVIKRAVLYIIANRVHNDHGGESEHD